MPDRLRVSGLLFLSAAATLCMGAAPSLAQTAAQVADLIVTKSSADSLDATPMLVAGNVVYFRGRDAAHGWELWRSEGTAESTRLVRDICPGPCDSSPAELAELGGEVYFVAGDGLTGRELWRSDGTAAGTLLVRDICPGSCSGIQPFHREPARAALIRAGDRLFFRADDPSGRELWTSDGTRDGTRLVIDLCPGPCSGRIFDLTAIGQDVAFRGDDLGHGYEPWRSDGTAAGTSMLGDVCPGLCSSGLDDDQPGTFFPFQGEIFVWLRLVDWRNCWDLWTTDAGLRGTGRLPQVCTPFFRSPPPLIELNGILYFASFPSLWKVETEPFRFQEITRFADGPGNLVRMGSQLFFTARTGEFGWEIWRSDGTPSGTVLLRDTAFGIAWGNPGNMTPAGDRLYFTTQTNILDQSGEELWISDGKSSFTTVLRPDPAWEDVSRFAALTAMGNQLFVAADSGEGRELWKTEGTGVRPDIVRVSGPSSDPGSAAPRGLAATGGTLFFGARKPVDSFIPDTVWRTDGTAAGTADLAWPGHPSAATLFGGSLFFDTGSQLLKTGGTADPAPFGHLSAAEMQPAGGRLFLSASGSTRPGDDFGRELWISDGTLAGTRLVRDILPGIDNPAPLLYLPKSSAPRGLTPLGSGVLFAAYDEERGEELWRSNGTEDGTVLVKDLCPGDCSPEIAELTSFGPRVIFSARDEASGRELWISDGTAEGTRLLLDLIPGPAGSAPRDLAVFRGRLLFFAGDASGQEQLWSTDGTAAGTSPVAVTTAAGLPRTPHEPVAAGDRLFFTTWTRAAGQELWVTDGTSQGTRLVADLLPGPASSYPHGLAAFGRLLLFTADDGQTGHELWISTGTAAGTRRLLDVAPGPASSAPTGMTQAGSRIFFAADDGVHGRELWTMDAAGLAAATSCVPAPDRLCLAGGRFGVTVRWRDQHNGGREGVGTAVPESGESGFFWFFAPGNLELVVKILDGQAVNGHHWVFYGALSDVEYRVTVTDYDTGEERTYHNPPGTFCGQADTTAFPALATSPGEPGFALLGASALELPAPEAAPGACLPGPDALCLLDGRFRVEARFKSPQDEGQATAVSRTDETGSFWFFDPANVELLVKVLDGRPVGGKFWLFYGALSDVEYWITVTDTATGATRTYHNPPGSYCGKADTQAF